MTTAEGADTSRQDTEPNIPLSPLTAALQEIIEINNKQGLCSPRVQGIIHRIHEEHTDQHIRDIIIGDPFTEQQKVIPAAKLTNSSSEWQVFADETGELGEVQQTIYFAKADKSGRYQAIPIFRMLEKANKQECSVALCLPAADATDLDWGIICTSADEGQAVTIDELLKDTPQTNAVVLDKLMLVLKGEQNLASLDLTETLHITELYQRAFPAAITTERFAKESHDTPKALLAKKLRNIGTLAMFAEANANTTVALPADGESIRLTPISDAQTTVEHVISNLGTKPKESLLGHITHPQSQELQFIPDIDLEQHFNPKAINEIINHAFWSYEIRNIEPAPAITRAINKLIADLIANTDPSRHADIFNAELRRMTQEWRQEKYGNDHSTAFYACLDLGNIDISQLGAGDYITATGGTLKASMKANKNQWVFADRSNKQPSIGPLYECVVEGADTAFQGVDNGRELYAKNCDRAFIGCNNVEMSVAERVRKAFVGVANNCIAVSCDKAFSDGCITQSVAIDCDQAFTRLLKGSEDLTVEFCKTKGGGRKFFTDFRGNSIKNKERKKLNLTSVHSTKYSPRNNYRAGKRLGKRPKS